VKGPHNPDKSSNPSRSKPENTKPVARPARPAQQTETRKSASRHRPATINGVWLYAREAKSGRNLFRVKLPCDLVLKFRHRAEHRGQSLVDMICDAIDMGIHICQPSTPN